MPGAFYWGVAGNTLIITSSQCHKAHLPLVAYPRLGAIMPRATMLRSEGAVLLSRLHEILERRQLTALFQPIIRMQGGEIVGYEGLIRGPSDSPLHSPMNLFKVARDNNLTVQVEHLCRRVTLERFAELNLPGKLFLNVSPECLLQPEVKKGETLSYIHEVGVNPQNVIIELTENEPTYDYELLRQAVMHYRDMGFQIAIGSGRNCAQNT